MRKQTKLVAVTSAAALLAIGASMTLPARYHYYYMQSNGKYYGFYPEETRKADAMLTGLCALAVDGDNWYFCADDDQIYMYANNKVLKDDAKKGCVMNHKLEDWKSWDANDVMDPLP